MLETPGIMRVSVGYRVWEALLGAQPPLVRFNPWDTSRPATTLSGVVVTVEETFASERIEIVTATDLRLLESIEKESLSAIRETRQPAVALEMGLWTYEVFLRAGRPNDARYYNGIPIRVREELASDHLYAIRCHQPPAWCSLGNTIALREDPENLWAIVEGSREGYVTLDELEGRIRPEVSLVDILDHWMSIPKRVRTHTRFHRILQD